MTDPTIAKMDIGFEVCAVAVFVWASVDYNRFIKFWMLKPTPYTKRVKIAFRLFFLACVAGGIWQSVEKIVTTGQSLTFYLSTLPFATAWFVVVSVMVRAVEKMNQKRLTKQSPPR